MEHTAATVSSSVPEQGVFCQRPVWRLTLTPYWVGAQVGEADAIIGLRAISTQVLVSASDQMIALYAHVYPGGHRVRLQQLDELGLRDPHLLVHSSADHG
jgi:hypothetical protein